MIHCCTNAPPRNTSTQIAPILEAYVFLKNSQNITPYVPCQCPKLMIFKKNVINHQSASGDQSRHLPTYHSSYCSN